MKHYSTHIFCTPEVHELPQAYTSEIASLLDGVKSNHSFYGQGVIGENIIGDKKDTFQSRYRKLSMNDCFELCQRIRKTRKDIDEHPDSFVVILTHKENDLKWFSATDGRNIYINVKDLELYSGNQTRYPIAFQILENIFQSICGIIYKENEIDERIHKRSHQCINDLCRQKSKIISKLKTASICIQCKDLARDNGISYEELEIFDTMLDSIKTPAIIKIKDEEENKKALIIDQSGQLQINGDLVKIDPLPFSFYVFFLQKNSAVNLLDLKKYVNEIALIYQKLKHKGEVRYKLSKLNIEKIRQKITSSREFIKNPEFSKIVSSINAVLESSIQPDLLNAFQLQSDGSSNYFIPIDKSLVKIDENFLLNK